MLAPSESAGAPWTKNVPQVQNRAAARHSSSARRSATRRARKVEKGRRGDDKSGGPFILAAHAWNARAVAPAATP